MDIKNSDDRVIEIVKIAEGYLDGNLSDTVFADIPDELYEGSMGAATAGIRACAEHHYNLLEERGMTLDTESRIRIAHAACVYASAMDALDLILAPHLERLAKINPDAASDLMSAIYGDREGGIGED